MYNIRIIAITYFLFSIVGCDNKHVVKTPDLRETNVILSEIIKRARMNKEINGKFEYLASDEAKLEAVLKREPSNVEALHILSWIYATYPRNRNTELLLRKSLTYARRAYDIAHKQDIFMYEILGAAEYANGNYRAAEKLFNYAINNAGSDKLRKEFSENKKRIKSIYFASE